jgi:hypothetical protein
MANDAAHSIQYQMNGEQHQQQMQGLTLVLLSSWQTTSILSMLDTSIWVCVHFDALDARRVVREIRSDDEARVEELRNPTTM